jgi:hypothetical protein
LGVVGVVNEMVADVAEHLISTGHLDPSGLSDAEVLKAAAQAMATNPALTAIEFGVSYDAELIGEADRLAEDRPLVALLLLVTCIEHLLNDILIRGLIERGSHKDFINRILWFRSPEKCGAVWRDVFGSPLDAGTRGAIKIAVDARNDFVHLKRFPKTVDPTQIQQISVGIPDDVLESARIGIHGLVAFRRDRFFKGFDRTAAVDVGLGG